MDHPEKSKHQPSRYSKKWGFMIGITIFICGCALPYGFVKLIWGNSHTVCFGTPFPTDADVEKEAFFKLPPSARKLVYETDGLGRKGGCTIWATFEIDPGDLEAFQKSTLIETFEETRLDRDPFPYFLQKKGWIQPANSTAGIGYNNDYPYTSQWVFIDTTDQNNFTVYIIVNQEWL